MNQLTKKYLLISKSEISQLSGIIEELQCFLDSCRYKAELCIDLPEHEDVSLPDFPTADELVDIF